MTAGLRAGHRRGRGRHMGGRDGNFDLNVMYARPRAQHVLEAIRRLPRAVNVFRTR